MIIVQKIKKKNYKYLLISNRSEYSNYVDRTY